MMTKMAVMTGVTSDRVKWHVLNEYEDDQFKASLE
jgi:hypothetical protein